MYHDFKKNESIFKSIYQKQNTNDWVVRKYILFVINYINVV